MARFKADDKFLQDAHHGFAGHSIDQAGDQDSELRGFDPVTLRQAGFTGFSTEERESQSQSQQQVQNQQSRVNGTAIGVDANAKKIATVAVMLILMVAAPIYLYESRLGGAASTGRRDSAFASTSAGGGRVAGVSTTPAETPVQSQAQNQTQAQSQPQSSRDNLGLVLIALGVVLLVVPLILFLR